MAYSHGFSAGYFDRLPLPCTSLWFQVAQARPGKMKGVHQSVLVSGTPEEFASGGRNLVRMALILTGPIRLVYIDGMQHRIGNAQKSFAVRTNSHCHMAWSVPGSRDGADTGNDFRFSIDEFEPTSYPRKIVARARNQYLFNRLFMH